VQRHWSPESAVNFRDLGGLPTSGGGRIRSGLLFRSASPQFLTTDDAARLVTDTPLRLVLDLRFADEAAVEGHGALETTDVRRVNLPVLGDGGGSLEMAILAGQQDLLGEHYISYVQHSPHAFVEVCRALAAPDGLPALLHCAAGKDRTGVMVAVLLSALGVPDDAVIADYARTSEHMSQVMSRLRTAQSYAATLALQQPDDEMAKSRPRTMRRFLGWLQREHGSARGLLVDAGLETDALDALHESLVVRPAA
jgi:protein tyrosine/serine phosphatase